MHLESVPPFLCCYEMGCSHAMHLALPSSTGVVMFKGNNGYPGVICSPPYSQTMLKEECDTT